MDGNYGVYFGKEMAGKVQVKREGLYYRFTCRCQLSGDVVCRLHVACGDKRESLGVVVPMDDGFGLDTRIPVKHLGEGEMEFRLIPKQESMRETAGETFVPVYPEEPFSYIERLKNAFLARKKGQVGVVIRE